MLEDGSILETHCSKCGKSTDHIYKPGEFHKLQCLRCQNLITDGWTIYPLYCEKCGAENMIVRPGKCVCTKECVV